MIIYRLTKQKFDFYKDLLELGSEEEIVSGLVNWIILSFYKLDEEQVYKLDNERIREFSLENELINWKCLGVEEVKKEQDTFVVYVSEAESRKLEEIIEKLMLKWGWKVRCCSCW